MSISPNDIKVQVRVVDNSYFVLGESQLGMNRLGPPDQSTNNYFLLGTSKLGQGYLGSTDSAVNSTWTTLTSMSTGFNIRRGAKRGNNPGEELEVGTVAVNLVGPDFDPAINNYIHAGVPMRILLLDSLVFVGWIRSATTDYGIDGKPRVVINGVDAVNKLAGLTKSALPEQTFNARVDALAGGTDINYNFTGGTRTLGAYDDSDSILNHLQRTLNTEGGYMFVNRAGNLQVRGGGFDTGRTLPVSLDLTDGSYNLPLEAGYDSQAYYNSLTYKNTIGGEEVEYGPYNNDASIGRNGISKATIESNFNSGSQIAAFADTQLTKYKSPKFQILSVSVDCTRQLSKALIDMYQVIKIMYYNQSFSLTAEFQIINISHKVTPFGWVMTMGLIPYERTA